MLNEITKKLVGTVCILPCGDSSLILDTVQNFVTLNQDSWSLLILSTFENSDKKNYQSIRKLSKKCRKVDFIVLNEKESGAHGWTYYSRVVAAAFDYIDTPLVVFCDGTCQPSLTGLQKIEDMWLYEKIGAVKGVIQSNSTKEKGVKSKAEKSFLKGEGIIEFALSDFQLQGTVYDRQLLLEHGIIDRLRTNFRSVQEFPALYLNTLVASSVKVALKDTILLVEKKNKKSKVPTEKYFNFNVNSYGRRCDQFIGARDVIFEAFSKINPDQSLTDFNASGFFQAYGKLYSKFTELIVEENGNLYADQMFDIEQVLMSFEALAICAVDQFPKYNIYQEYLSSYFAMEQNTLLSKIACSKLPVPKQKNLETFYSRASKLDHRSKSSYVAR